MTRPGKRVALLLVLLAVGALAFWGIDQTPGGPSRPESAAGAPRNPEEPAALVAPKTQSLAPKTDEMDVGAHGSSNGLEVTGVQARHMDHRSPLESAPGYYPPADPESLSVVRGRRNAVPVDMELSGGAPSLEALARGLLAGIEKRDEHALHALRVTREEFSTIVWPELPQSRPITHIPISEVWGLGLAQSHAGAGRTIGAYGGRPLTLLRADYGHEEPFLNYTLLRDVRILIRDSRDGGMVGLRFMPSVIQRHGRYKALIFKD